MIVCYVHFVFQFHPLHHPTSLLILYVKCERITGRLPIDMGKKLAVGGLRRSGRAHASSMAADALASQVGHISLWYHRTSYLFLSLLLWTNASASCYVLEFCWQTLHHFLQDMRPCHISAPSTWGSCWRSDTCCPAIASATGSPAGFSPLSGHFNADAPSSGSWWGTDACRHSTSTGPSPPAGSNLIKAIEWRFSFLRTMAMDWCLWTSQFQWRLFPYRF